MAIKKISILCILAILVMTFSNSALAVRKGGAPQKKGIPITMEAVREARRILKDPKARGKDNAERKVKEFERRYRMVRDRVSRKQFEEVMDLIGLKGEEGVEVAAMNELFQRVNLTEAEMNAGELSSSTRNPTRLSRSQLLMQANAAMVEMAHHDLVTYDNLKVRSVLTFDAVLKQLDKNLDSEGKMDINYLYNYRRVAQEAALKIVDGDFDHLKKENRTNAAFRRAAFENLVVNEMLENHPSLRARKIMTYKSIEAEVRADPSLEAPFELAKKNARKRMKKECPIK